MSKSERRKPVPNRQPLATTLELRNVLTRQKKADLIEIVLQLAEIDRNVYQWLTARFEVETSPADLVAVTRLAIADATDFDDRELNSNFDYDDEAYAQVKRNLGRLIGSEELRQSMELALELMKRGSYQVEMSDEGLMTSDIEDCLNVVIEALAKCDLPASEVAAWYSAMLKLDRVGFICQEPLESRSHSNRSQNASSGPLHGRQATSEALPRFRSSSLMSSVSLGSRVAGWRDPESSVRAEAPRSFRSAVEHRPRCRIRSLG